MASAVKWRDDAAAALVVVSIVAGATYPLLDTWLLTALAGTVLKGAGVGLLALAATARARSADGRLLAAVLAAGATGDVLLDLPGGFVAGAAAFAAGHLLAIILYLRHRDRAAAGWRWLAAGALLGTGLAAPVVLLAAGPQRTGIQVYALLLCAMAAAALLSRFRRDRVALGAAMFVASDALIGARLGGALPATLAVSLAIWWLYYLGQLAIFAGVSEGLILPCHPRDSGDSSPAASGDGSPLSRG